MKPLRILSCPEPDHCAGYYIATNAPPDHPQAGQLLPCACTRRTQASGHQTALAIEDAGDDVRDL